RRPWALWRSGGLPPLLVTSQYVYCSCAAPPTPPLPLGSWRSGGEEWRTRSDRSGRHGALPATSAAVANGVADSVGAVGAPPLPFSRDNTPSIYSVLSS